MDGGALESIQQVCSTLKSIKERDKGKQRANSRKQATGEERGQAVFISSSRDVIAANILEESAIDIQVVCVEKSNGQKRAKPLKEASDPAEPKPK